MKESLEANQWQQLILSAKLSICVRGSRAQLEACQTAVETSLATPHRRARFIECLRKKEARADVHRLEKGTTLPKFAEFLDLDDRQLKDWYIAYCDPALPQPGSASVVASTVAEPSPDGTPGEGETTDTGEDPPVQFLAHLDELGIETYPPGAAVEVDGQPRGRTPVKLRLKPRSHRISVSLMGAKATWKVSPGDPQTYCLEMKGVDLVQIECR